MSRALLRCSFACTYIPVTRQHHAGYICLQATAIEIVAPIFKSAVETLEDCLLQVCGEGNGMDETLLVSRPSSLAVDHKTHTHL